MSGGGGLGGRKTNMYKEAMFSTIDYTLNRNISDPVGSERYHFKSFFILIFFKPPIIFFFLISYHDY